VLQLDEPAFNVYMDDVRAWGIEALHRAIEGLSCKTAVHICYGYGIKANIDWKQTLGSRVAPVRADVPAARGQPHRPGLARVRELARAGLAARTAERQGRAGRRVDVATRHVETPDAGGGTIRSALTYVPAERLYPCTNCGMVPLAPRGRAGQAQAPGAGRRSFGGSSALPDRISSNFCYSERRA
jgi:5-methyltetrahydropteroyltriglutamate--homocysteine methyltransferase